MLSKVLVDTEMGIEFYSLNAVPRDFLIRFLTEFNLIDNRAICRDKKERGAYMDQIKISFSQTSEKFITEATEIALPFIDLFQDYIKEISPILAAYHSLLKKNVKGEYHKEITAVLSKSQDIKLSYFSDFVTNNIYITPQDTSPSRFAHFITGCEIDVIMKTKKRIMLVASFLDSSGNECFHQFIIKPTEDKWLLDFIGIGYEDATGPFRKWNTI